MHSARVHPLLLPALRTFSRNLSRRKMGFALRSKPTKKLFLALKRDAYDKNQDGRVVDENMIVLRMRIHDMKMAELNEDQNVVPDDQQSYSSAITIGIGMLKLMLMETPPSFALGILAFVLLSVVTSMVAIALVLIHMAKVATLAVNCAIFVMLPLAMHACLNHQL